MKVLSLQQPWASLVVIGAKKIETRSWAPNKKTILEQIMREGILIHASEKWTRELSNLAEQPPFWEYMKKYWPEDEPYKPFSKLPTGAIIGHVDFLQAGKTENFVSISEDRIKCGWAAEINWEEELQFGDYTPGRKGWLLKNAREFEEPVKCKGALSLWDCPVGVLLQISENLNV